MKVGSIFKHPLLSISARVTAVTLGRAHFQWLPSGRCFSLELGHARAWFGAQE